jgi:hypothetical protein
MKMVKFIRRILCRIAAYFHHHDWHETAWNTWGTGVEEQCRCGASRWFAFINGAHRHARIGWNPGPHPGRDELASISPNLRPTNPSHHVR